MAKQDTNAAPRSPWLPRFGLAEMMLAMLIFSVMAGAGFYLMQANSAGKGPGRAVFAIYTLAAPVALVLLLSVYKSLRRWIQMRRRG